MRRLLCIIVVSIGLARAVFAQTSAVDRARELQTTSNPPIATADSTSNDDYGYAPNSGNDADLGEQHILKRVEQYQAFTLQIGTTIYYTTNVALVRSGEHGDAIISPGFALTWQPRINRTLFFELGVQQQWFDYARFDEFNFGSFGAFAGVIYYLPRLHNLTLHARYDFNRLTNDHWDEFFSDHAVTLAAEVPFQLSRAHSIIAGADARISFASTPDAPGRDDYEGYVAYQVGLTRQIGLAAAAKFAVRDYSEGRTDTNELLSLSASYRVTPWLTLNAISSVSWNQSNSSFFEYEVANIGGAIGAAWKF